MAYPEQWLWATLEKATGFRAWPAEAPQTESAPYCVFARAETARERHLTGGLEQAVATFNVWIYTPKYLDGKAAADRARVAMDNFGDDGSENTIRGCFLTAESDGEPVDFTGEGKSTYVNELVFEVRFSE